MLYTAAYKLASAAIEQYMEREKAAQDEELALRTIAAVTAAIEAAKQEILQMLNRMQIDDQRGNLIGLGVSLDAYRTMNRTSDFLTVIQRDSDALTGHLDVLLQNNWSNFDLAMETNSMVLAHTSLRIFLFSEFKYHWARDPVATDNLVRGEISKALSPSEELAVRLRHTVEERIIPQGNQPIAGGRSVGSAWFDPVTGRYSRAFPNDGAPLNKGVAAAKKYFLRTQKKRFDSHVALITKDTNLPQAIDALNQALEFIG